MTFHPLIFIAGLLTFIIPVGAAAISGVVINDSPTEIRTVPCYDRFSNLIEGVTCEEEYLTDQLAQTLKDLEFAFVLFLILGIFGSGIIMMSALGEI